jgi:hypothetical protein
MTDDSKNLTPAQPVSPRRKLPANPRMAQPVRSPIIEPNPVFPTNEQLALDEQATEREPVTASGAETDAGLDEVEVETAAPLPQATELAAPAAELNFPRTMRETLRHVDDAFAAFRALAARFPSERMDERIGPDGWTRKQMLEHVAAWHDLTADRVVQMINTGQSAPLDRDTDGFNAAVARQAVGKTSGEVLKDIDATFNRLRRQLARVTDAQLSNDDWWLAFVIGGNTYGHYEEHWADIYTPHLLSNNRGRR